MSPDPDVLMVTPESAIVKALGPLIGGVFTTYRDELEPWLNKFMDGSP